MSVVPVEIENQIAVVTIDNPPVNTASTALRQELLDAVAKVQGCQPAIRKCAGRAFIAGGDISELETPHLPDVVREIEDSKTPLVAILRCTVLSGGTELAMTCAFRFAAPNTRFGLPKVNMGPFEAQDMAGLQIAEAKPRRQDAARDPAERYVTISDMLCFEGRYGQRCGKGWYDYPMVQNPKRTRPIEIASILHPAQIAASDAHILFLSNPTGATQHRRHA